MKQPDQTEQEYVERIARLIREGAIRGSYRRVFSKAGIVFGSCFLLFAAGVCISYLHLGGSFDDWRFVFGFGVGVLLCPGLFAVAVGLARVMDDMASSESRPFTLMVKYHDHLIREGLDPYDAT